MRFIGIVAFVFLAACGGGDGPLADNGEGGAVAPLVFAPFQAAGHVIGQPDFASSTENQGANPAANTFQGQTLLGAHASILLVTDYDNARLLSHAIPVAQDNAAALSVLGQPDFSGSAQGTAADMFISPHDAHVADGKLFVADAGNHRVLIWNSVPAANTPADS